MAAPPSPPPTQPGLEEQTSAFCSARIVPCPHQSWNCPSAHAFHSILSMPLRFVSWHSGLGSGECASCSPGRPGPSVCLPVRSVVSAAASAPQRLKGTSRFGVDYDRQVNLPRPAEMVAKFLPGAHRRPAPTFPRRCCLPEWSMPLHRHISPGHRPKPRPPGWCRRPPDGGRGGAGGAAGPRRRCTSRSATGRAGSPPSASCGPCWPSPPC